MLELQEILVLEVIQEIQAILEVMEILEIQAIQVVMEMMETQVHQAILEVVVNLVHLAILVNLELLVVTGVNPILAVVLLVVLWQDLNIPSSLMEVTLE